MVHGLQPVYHDNAIGTLQQEGGQLLLQLPLVTLLPIAALRETLTVSTTLPTCMWDARGDCLSC